jgi:hypothetical protein
MVTVILAFIFLTPRSVFKDSPTYLPPHPNEVIVTPDGGGGFVYELSASAVPREESDKGAALKRSLQPVAGNVEITRYEELRNGLGKVTGYRVWAHR